MLVVSPTFTVLMGANGAGKSTWRREHRADLPLHFYDADAIAQGLGGYDEREHQKAARRVVDRFIEKRLERREPFGLETTYSGMKRPDLVRRVHGLGYACRAIFLGTKSSRTNTDRVRVRVAAQTGHGVGPNEVRRRWRAVRDNLVATRNLFETITVIDSTTAFVVLFEYANGRIRESQPDLPEWAVQLRAGITGTAG